MVKIERAHQSHFVLNFKGPYYVVNPNTKTLRPVLPAQQIILKDQMHKKSIFAPLLLRQVPHTVNMEHNFMEKNCSLVSLWYD